MLSARTIYGEIFDHDEAFGLFCSIAAGGEAQGGWENGKIAVLVPGSRAGRAARIARHGAEEDRHGRVFTALLRRRGPVPVPVPADADCAMRLEAAGIGLAHARLRRGEELTGAGIVTCLAHGRVTEQRASEQMRALLRHAGDRPGTGRAARVICDDEDDHLACCHEELLRLAAAGHGGVIRAALRAAARAEIAIDRGVSLAVMAYLGRILGWHRPRSAVLAAGIRAVCACERLGGWRRMAAVRMPARRNALGGPVPARPRPA